jgi:hypothetical protein
MLVLVMCSFVGMRSCFLGENVLGFVLCLDADEDLASGVVAIHVETEGVECGVLISVERDFDLSEDNEAGVVWELVCHLGDGFTSELLEICVAMSLEIDEGSLTAM